MCPRPLAQLALPLLLVAAGACVPRQAGPLGHETPFVPGIRIISAGQASERGLAGRPFELRFGDNQDGTKLVLDFLEQAKRAGARFVSGIRIELHTRQDDMTRICTTQLLPFVKTQTYTVPHRRPGRTEQRSVMKPVTRTVTESVYRCSMRSVPVMRSETQYRSQYDYTSKTSRMVPVTRMVTRYEMRNECRTEMQTRTVTRYEHQLETRYIPPRLEYISKHYTDFDLVEGRPLCTTARQAHPGRQPHRIAGTIYRAAGSAEERT